MKTLLHIEASPRGERSHSSTVAKAYRDAWQKAHPNDHVDHWNLWNQPPPAFDPFAMEAKFAVMGGQTFTAEQKAAWDVIVSNAKRFKRADIILLSVPMWNFGMPYILKQLFDAIIQPGLTFSYSPDTGYSGLVTGKKAVAVYARGGAYGPGSGAEAYDSQITGVEQLLGFMGITEIKRFILEPTMAPNKDEIVARLSKEAAAFASWE